MNADRLKQLEKYYKENPNDPFIVYALAIENLDFNNELSKSLFVKLLTNHPEYIATYYHAAELFVLLDDLEKAKSTYQKGIEMARKQNELKAMRELEGAYQNFLFEYED